MEIKVIDLYQIVDKIGVLLGADLPIASAFKVHRISKIMDSELKDVEELRLKIVDKYKESENKETGEIQLKKELLKDYQKDIEELFDQVVEVDIKPVSLSELEGVTLTPSDFGALETIIIEEE